MTMSITDDPPAGAVRSLVDHAKPRSVELELAGLPFEAAATRSARPDRLDGDHVAVLMTDKPHARFPFGGEP